jgi:hypothetical protein
MKDSKPNNASVPIERRSVPRRAGSSKGQRGFVERATATGHSGHGAESVRPHLRDQLRLKALLPQPYPTPPESRPAAKDDHHR